MREIVIQGMRSSLPTSWIAADRIMLRSGSRPALPRWVCGCVEGRILWPGSWSQGVEDIHQERLREDYSRELPVMLSAPVYSFMC